MLTVENTDYFKNIHNWQITAKKFSFYLFNVKTDLILIANFEFMIQCNKINTFKG